MFWTHYLLCLSTSVAMVLSTLFIRFWTHSFAGYVSNALSAMLHTHVVLCSLLCLEHVIRYGLNTLCWYVLNTLCCYGLHTFACYVRNTLLDLAWTQYLVCFERIICYVSTHISLLFSNHIICDVDNTWFVMFRTHYLPGSKHRICCVSNTNYLYGLNTIAYALNTLVDMFQTHHLLCFEHIVRYVLTTFACYVLNTWLPMF